MLEQAAKDDMRGLDVYRITIYPTHCFKTWNRHYGPTHASILYFKEVEKISRGTLRPEWYSFCDISGNMIIVCTQILRPIMVYFTTLYWSLLIAVANVQGQSKGCEWHVSKLCVSRVSGSNHIYDKAFTVMSWRGIVVVQTKLSR